MYELLGGEYRDKVRSYPAIFQVTAEKSIEECKCLNDSIFVGTGERTDKDLEIVIYKFV